MWGMPFLGDVLQTWVPAVLILLALWVGERHGYRRGRASR